MFVQPVYAAEWTGSCVGGSTGDVATIRGITCLIGNILSPLPMLLALVAAAMIIMGGVRLILSGSDPKAYAAAWQQITYAVIGLILIGGVWLILVFIQQFTGAQVTNFGFPQ